MLRWTARDASMTLVRAVTTTPIAATLAHQGVHTPAADATTDLITRLHSAGPSTGAPSRVRSGSVASYALVAGEFDTRRPRGPSLTAPDPSPVKGKAPGVCPVCLHSGLCIALRWLCSVSGLCTLSAVAVSGIHVG
jgi:hypothetical protein